MSDRAHPILDLISGSGQGMRFTRSHVRRFFALRSLSRDRRIHSRLRHFLHFPQSHRMGIGEPVSPIGIYVFRHSQARVPGPSKPQRQDQDLAMPRLLIVVTLSTQPSFRFTQMTRANLRIHEYAVRCSFQNRIQPRPAQNDSSTLKDRLSGNGTGSSTRRRRRT